MDEKWHDASAKILTYQDLNDIRPDISESSSDKTNGQNPRTDAAMLPAVRRGGG